ncbi:MAG: radical SAM protein [Prevotellaceae bacterium]|nr:radical SAM protein [Prevotellaceae bacterium]
MKLNISKYNIFLTNYVICNLLSKKYIKVNEELYSFLRGQKSFELNDFDNDVLIELLDANIITQSDELSTIDYRYNALKFANNKASYIIYPTLNCNFSCNYCYQIFKGSSLSNDKEKILQQFLLNTLHNLNELKILWSGGEPLLKWDFIKRTNLAILKSADNNLDFYSDIATNGYLINDKIADEMQECNISILQITVDGSEEEHNKIRFSKTDKNTYTSVINGIKKAAKNIKVRIRLNINHHNTNSFDSFLDDLEKNNCNNSNISIFVKRILAKQDNSSHCTLLNDNEFYEYEIKYAELAHKKGFNYSLHPSWESSIRCAYHHINSFAIDPNLLAYKCALEIGMQEKSIGSIDETSRLNLRENVLTGLLYSPLTIEECRKCMVLPICGGKCPIEWERQNRQKEAGCVPDKQSISIKLNNLLNH